MQHENTSRTQINDIKFAGNDLFPFTNLNKSLGISSLAETNFRLVWDKE